MSYYCSISFKKLDPSEIIPFFQNFKQACKEKMVEIAQREYSYCPYIRSNLEVPESFVEVTQAQKQEAIVWADDAVFKFKYFYDAEFQLLGVLGVTSALQCLFDATIDFQNSTDQDYKRFVWEGIPQFESLFDAWMQTSDHDVKIAYNMAGDDFDADYDEYADDNAKIKEKLDYTRRTLCYKEIWGRYEEYLWESSKSIYFSVYGYYERNELMTFVKHCHEAQVQWQIDFEKKWNEQHNKE